MLRRALSLMLVLFLTATTFALVPLSASGEEESTLEDLIAVGKEADMFYYFVDYGFYAWCSYPESADENMVSFAKEKGYITDTPGQGIAIDFVHFECGYYYPYAPKMNSLEKWEDEIKSYFTEDFLGLLEQALSYRLPHVTEKDGVTYGTSLIREQRIYFDWDEVKLTHLTKNTAVLTAPTYYYDMNDRENDGEKTIELVKTERGWRVSGGSYFGNADSLPKAGDHTVAYMVIGLLAAAPCGVTLAALGKKRRAARL